MERTLHNIDFEQTVLGEIFKNNNLYWSCLNLGLREYHFAEPMHEDIYKQIDRLVPASKVCDPTTIKDIDKNYLIKIAVANTSSVLIKNYVEGIIDLYKKDLLKNTVSEIDYDLDSKEIKEQILESIISYDEEKSDLICSSLVAEEVANEIIENKHKPIYTGYDSLDNITRGFCKSELVVVAGRTGMGKTTFCLNLCRQMSHNTKIAFFSLEMNKKEILQKLAAANTNKKLSMFENPQNMEEAKFIKESILESVNDNLFLDVSPKLSVNQIKSKLIKHKKRNGIDVAIIDYVGLIQKNTKINSVAYQVEEITKELKVIAKELEITVILLAQINRGAEAEKSKRPSLTGLRDSGSLEQDANTVLLLYRPYYYLQRELEKDPDNNELQKLCIQSKNKFEVIVAKNRKGALDTAELTWHAECQKIT